MVRRSSLGKLLIAFGPQVRDQGELDQHVGRYRTGPHEVTSRFHNFHAFAFDDDPDPFRSRCFGPAVKALTQGRIVIVTDGVFEDYARRSKVEQAFRRTWPELEVHHVQVGGGDTAAGGLDEQIVFDGDVYEEGEDGSHESIVVESTDDAEQVRRALAGAAGRMMQVDEHGHEHPDIPVFYAPDRGLRPGTAAELAAVGVDVPSRDEVYTPNYVAAVREDEHGNLGFSIDCKGAIEPPMADRFRRILLEEFKKAGVRSAHVRVPG